MLEAVQHIQEQFEPGRYSPEIYKYLVMVLVKLIRPQQLDQVLYQYLDDNKQVVQEFEKVPNIDALPELVKRSQQLQLICGYTDQNQTIS